MADLGGPYLNEYSGGSSVWSSGLAGNILLAYYFTPVSPPILDTVYKGVKPWGSFYRGIRTDSELYLGAKTLR